MKLRVVMVTRFPFIENDSFSGLFQVSLNLCNALAQRDNIHLHVISSTSRTRSIVHRKMSNYIVTYVPNPHNYAHYLSFFTISANRLRCEVHHQHPDLVHCQATPETTLASLFTGLPMVTTVHGIYSQEALTEHTWKARVVSIIQKQVELWYTKRLQDVITGTPYVTNFVRHYNPSTRLYPISNPIDPTFFKVDPHRIQPLPHSIIMVGVISNRKGQDLLIEAVRRLVPQFSDLQATIVGNDGDLGLTSALKKKVHEADLESHIRWLGPVSQDRLIEEMTRHQFLCLPSREDSLPLSISQGMAIGNICIASDAGGIPYMIQHEQNGYLFPRGNVDAFASILASLLPQPVKHWGAMRQKNRRFAEQTYHPTSVAAQTVSAYEAVIRQTVMQ